MHSNEQLSLLCDKGYFKPFSELSLMTIQVHGQPVLELDSRGMVNYVDAELRLALGKALWSFLKNLGVIQVTEQDAANPPPDIYCTAALEVFRALTPFLQPQEAARS